MNQGWGKLGVVCHLAAGKGRRWQMAKLWPIRTEIYSVSARGGILWCGVEWPWSTAGRGCCGYSWWYSWGCRSIGDRHGDLPESCLFACSVCLWESAGCFCPPTDHHPMSIGISVVCFAIHTTFPVTCIPPSLNMPCLTRSAHQSRWKSAMTFHSSVATLYSNDTTRLASMFFLLRFLLLCLEACCATISDLWPWELPLEWVWNLKGQL